VRLGSGTELLLDLAPDLGEMNHGLAAKPKKAAELRARLASASDGTDAFPDGETAPKAPAKAGARKKRAGN
jgi:hypothetical protein